MKILVTGSAGFIGSMLSLKLLERGDEIIGIDNHNDYYDPKIKEGRLKRLKEYSNYKHYRLDLCDQKDLKDVFKNHQPIKVVNLAAQAGVRYSIENPLAYINSNIVGFTHVLENCRQHKVEHLVYASTSSVYGSNTKMPFSEHDSANHPLSIYAASKKSNELMAHSYSHLFQLPTTGLRFFTVYGPWGRPDMALFLFTEAIFKNKPIKVFNYGNMVRDFTYVGDVVNANILASQSEKVGKGEVINIGNGDNRSINEIADMIGDNKVNVDPVIEPPETLADNSKARELLGWEPKGNIDTWIPKYKKEMGLDA